MFVWLYIQISDKNFLIEKNHWNFLLLRISLMFNVLYPVYGGLRPESTILDVMITRPRLINLNNICTESFASH